MVKTVQKSTQDLRRVGEEVNFEEKATSDISGRKNGFLF